MECAACHCVTHSDRCENPTCPSNTSQFNCPACRTISPGLYCSNPGCATYDQNELAIKWNRKLIRNQYQGLDWGQLLSVLDSVTIEHIKKKRKKPNISSYHQHGMGPVHYVQFPKCSHWLWLCSDKSGPSLNWVPAKISLRYGGFEVWVIRRDEADARVYFPPVFFRRGDLRYFEIGFLFKQMGNSSDAAAEMLERVRGNYTRTFGAEYDGFIDAMIVLMFGVESARNWSTCATSLMLLELIANGVSYGSGGTKVFNLANAFHHDYKMWDETTYYGGKHPMATHGTGTGNLIDRGKIVSAKGLGWEPEVSINPKRHMVVYRELSVLWHWLQFTERRLDYQGLTVEERIQLLLLTYLP